MMADVDLADARDAKQVGAKGPGSVMAHTSLAARECGIPAVVETGTATQKLQDGMLVTVDGSAGVVLQVG
jgi:phosphohistidine swiveling domain-containing protein